MKTLPGSAIGFAEENRLNAFERFAAVINATNGLTLSQLCDITGLNATTIQNWIKRGWVANPKDKRYGEVQLARIILINMVRDVLPLEMIAEIMSAVNGSVELREDDMLPDRDWYNLLCRCIFEFEDTACKPSNYDERLTHVISRVLAEYTPVTEDERKTLYHVLFIMVNAYEASAMKKNAFNEWNIMMRRNF